LESKVRAGPPPLPAQGPPVSTLRKIIESGDRLYYFDLGAGYVLRKAKADIKGKMFFILPPEKNLYIYIYNIKLVVLYKVACDFF